MSVPQTPGEIQPTDHQHLLSLPSFPPTASINSSPYPNSGKRPLLYQRPATQAPRTPGKPPMENNQHVLRGSPAFLPTVPPPKPALITISQPTILAEAPALPEVTLVPRTPQTPEATLALHPETQRPSRSPTPKWRQLLDQRGLTGHQDHRPLRPEDQGKYNHPTKKKT